jgi:hypothetical protein
VSGPRPGVPRRSAPRAAGCPARRARSRSATRPSRCRHSSGCGLFPRDDASTRRHQSWGRHCCRAGSLFVSRRVGLLARYPEAVIRPRAFWAKTAPVWSRRSSASPAPATHLRRRRRRARTRDCAHRRPPRAHRARAWARPVRPQGGRSSDPTSGRSLLQVAPACGAGGTRRAAPLRVASPVRSDESPRLTARARSLSSRSRGSANIGETLRSVTAKRTKQATTATASETALATEFGGVNALDLVILDGSLLADRLRPAAIGPDRPPAREPGGRRRPPGAIRGRRPGRGGPAHRRGERSGR